MKKLWMALWLFAAGHTAYAQSLVQVAFYFDQATTPDYVLPVPSLDSIEQAVQIPVGGLSQGLHQLYIKTKDQSGKWSHYATRTFLIEGAPGSFTLNTAEYFFDNDPGTGNGVALNFTPTESLDADFNLSTTGLTQGLHSFYLRVRNAAGDWSIAVQRKVLIEGATGSDIIAYGEYFFDTDPGVGNGTLFEIPAVGLFEETLSVPTDNLQPGLHTLAIRIRNEAGHWSFATSKKFLIEGRPGFNYLVQGEYFIDNDPGTGNGEAFSIAQLPSLNSNYNIPLNPELMPGNYTIHVRVRDGSGQWSFIAHNDFEIFDDLPCDYDLNNDDAVNTADLLILISQFGNAGQYSGDFDGNQMVNVMDMLALLSAVGNTCF